MLAYGHVGITGGEISEYRPSGQNPFSTTG